MRAIARVSQKLYQQTNPDLLVPLHEALLLVPVVAQHGEALDMDGGGRTYVNIACVYEGCKPAYRGNNTHCTISVVVNYSAKGPLTLVVFSCSIRVPGTECAHTRSAAVVYPSRKVWKTVTVTSPRQWIAQVSTAHNSVGSLSRQHTHFLTRC